MVQLDDSGASAEPRHVPVMLSEVLEYLAPSVGQVIVDATVGAGGHAREIAGRLGDRGKLICIDRDPRMLEVARRRVAGGNVAWIEASFAELRSVLDELNISRVDGVLMDLGVASDQIDDPERGFSFMRPGPLDMRMNPSVCEPARTIINTMSAEMLADIFYQYGEERHSRRVARAIVRARHSGAIETTEELAQIIRRALPRRRSWQRIDPATRVFQALRIAVNDELNVLQQCMDNLTRCIEPGGRAVIISFHSLEDRIVKQAFRNEPWERLTRKPVTPSEAEIERNPRARSAKLRAAALRQAAGGTQERRLRS
jgi:16S rRNA (cytosine1402-N4)-methyltransferase